MSGQIIYHGPSMIDGAEIVVIATGDSKNDKTGNMIQTWILGVDIAPHIAAKDGRDVSICGECPLRTNADGKRACYVRTHEASLSVWRAFHRGSYRRANPADFGAGAIVRIGSYGDPAAVPAHVWERFVSRSIGRTGYTHQWQHSDPVVRRNAEALRGIVMASADSPETHDAAEAADWRAFRIRRADQPLLPGERVCPASAEAGYKTTCAACRACSGTAGRGHSSIAIIAHGNGAKYAVAA